MDGRIESIDSKSEYTSPEISLCMNTNIRCSRTVQRIARSAREGSETRGGFGSQAVFSQRSRRRDPQSRLRRSHGYPATVPGMCNLCPTVTLHVPTVAFADGWYVVDRGHD